jgi:hypothetical protein
MEIRKKRLLAQSGIRKCDPEVKTALNRATVEIDKRSDHSVLTHFISGM